MYILYNLIITKLKIYKTSFNPNLKAFKVRTL